MKAARRTASNQTGGPRITHLREGTLMSNGTCPEPAQAGKLQVLCAAVRGVFSGAARAVTDWAIRTFVER